MAEPINVPIITSYDDKAAKEAIDDAEKIDKLEPEIEITADDEATDKLEDVEESAEQLDKLKPEVTVTADDNASADIKSVKDDAEALSKADAEIVLRAKVDAAKAELASLQAELKTTGERAEDTNRQLDRIGGDTGGISTKGNAIADLTGPLGEASGAASDFAGVFDGLGDIAGDVGQKMGLSASAAASLSGVVGGLGIAVAAGAAAWTIFQGNQKKAREEAEKTIKVQKDLNQAILDGDQAASVAAFKELYGDVADEAVKAGVPIEEVTAFLFGQADAVTSLEDRIVSLTRQRDAEANTLAKQRAAGDAAVSQTQLELQSTEDQLQALKDLRSERETNVAAQADQAAWDRAIAKQLGYTTDALHQYEDGQKAINEQIIEGQQNLPNLIDLEEERATGLRDSAAAHRENVDALTEQINAQRAAADSTFALHDAEANYAESLATVDQELKDSEGDLLKQRQILEGVASNAADVADAMVRVAEDEAKAAGKVVTATQKIDLQNDALIDQAAQASGPTRDAILDYIASVNDIPPEKISEIRALIDQGKLGEAQAALDQASATRDVALVADAETTQAETDLQKAADKRYTVDFYARAVDARGRPLSGGLVVGSPSGGADGNTATPGMAVPTVATAIAAPMVVNVNMPKGARGVDVLRQVSSQARRSGRRYGTPVVHYARRP